MQPINLYNILVRVESNETVSIFYPCNTSHYFNNGW